MIILVSGKMRSGKDTFANYLTGKLRSPWDPYGEWVPIKFADELKNRTCAFFGEDLDFEAPLIKEMYRPFLISVGQLCRDINPDYWAMRAAQKIERLKNEDYSNFIISDCRFPNEIDYIKRVFSDELIITVRIVARLAKMEERGAMPRFFNDESEISLDNYHFDYTIDNSSSLGEFNHQIDKFIEGYNLCAVPKE